MKALIFIPDISGYTEFVNQTEIKHSKHIISELLETILEGNILDLQVSEIEGDAILFYRKGKAPSLSELINQSRKNYLDFHTHLKIIQRDNVCQCGACRSAINLTLKFIVHYGELDETIIGNFTKIIGSDVILAHRLLKNKIGKKEYLLITEICWHSLTPDKIELSHPEPFNQHSEFIENFDNVNIRYTSLSFLQNQIEEAATTNIKYTAKGNPDATILIKAPLLVVHELLIDNDAKLEYVPGIREVNNSSSVNRVNASHTCVFEDFQVHFVTLSSEVNEKELRYVEQADLSSGIVFITDYSLKASSAGTTLSVRIFPKLVPQSGKTISSTLLDSLKKRILLCRLKTSAAKNLILFKNYCEKISMERKQ